MWRPEYFVRYAPFPHNVEGVTLPNDDGTFDIYISSALPDLRKAEVLEHELRHIKQDHFYSERFVAAVEAQASGRETAGAVCPLVFRVPDNTMEPFFPQDSVVPFVAEAPGNGDIGVFELDGAKAIRQFLYDDVMGIVYLFALNRKRQDADAHFMSKQSDDLVCWGKVLTECRFPIPG